MPSYKHSQGITYKGYTTYLAANNEYIIHINIYIHTAVHKAHYNEKQCCSAVQAFARAIDQNSYPAKQYLFKEPGFFSGTFFCLKGGKSNTLL